MKKNYDNWMKNKKVIQSQQMSKICLKIKIFSSKINKGAAIFKKTQKLSK